MNTMNINPNESSSQSQTKMIGKYLADGHKLTALEALRLFDCLNLKARIFDLRDSGMNIATEWVTTSTGKRVAQYRLITEGKA